jgi:hypothetical protein
LRINLGDRLKRIPHNGLCAVLLRIKPRGVDIAKPRILRECCP